MDSNIIDKIQDAVIMAGSMVGQTAVELKERAELSYEIRTRENYLDELYKELGKKYYSEHKDDEGEAFTEIANLLDELEKLRTEMAERKGVDHCPRCGAQVSREADYCGKCGEYLKE